MRRRNVSTVLRAIRFNYFMYTRSETNFWENLHFEYMRNDLFSDEDPFRITMLATSSDISFLKFGASISLHTICMSCNKNRMCLHREGTLYALPHFPSVGSSSIGISICALAVCFLVYAFRLSLSHSMWAWRLCHAHLVIPCCVRLVILW